MTQHEIFSAAIRQSAVDCSCSAEDFRRPENVIVPAGVSEGMSRYMEVPPVCTLISYGANVVASCREELLPDVADYVNSQRTIYRGFETPAIYDLNRILEKAGARVSWMHSFFLPDPDLVFGADLPCAFETREMHPADFANLYLPEWSNALSFDRKELDTLGIGAFDGDRLIGMAGCSADCPDMWQIGIDVLPEYRRKGIASALTNRLARMIFEREKIPFYAAAWSNIRSIRNGLRSGFVPAWVAITSKAV